jgi:uncharacterized protein (TIGR02145 family)
MRVANLLFPIAVLGMISMTYLRCTSQKEIAKQERQTPIVKDTEGNPYSSKILLDSNRWTTQNMYISLPDSYCYDDVPLNCDKYGRLFTWEAAKTACEALGDGWRLPTNDEWHEMARYYGGVREDSEDNGQRAFHSLLDSGDSGFNALLAGNRNSDGTYGRLERHGFYWTSTEYDTGTAWFYNFGRGSMILARHEDGQKDRACSVRCIQDTGMNK